jgi:hypothetical protein
MASSVPNAVNAFLSIAQTALPVNSLVWFGKPLGVYTAPVTLQVVGVHTGEQVVATIGPEYKREETYEIQCVLTSFAGDANFAGRMAEVFAAFGLLTLAIGNNPTLNQTVRFAEIHSFEYSPDADAKGMTLGELPFTVACQARISSLT